MESFFVIYSWYIYRERERAEPSDSFTKSMKKDENEKFNLETTEWIWEPPIHVLIAIDFFLCVCAQLVCSPFPF